MSATVWAGSAFAASGAKDGTEDAHDAPLPAGVGCVGGTDSSVYGGCPRDKDGGGDYTPYTRYPVKPRGAAPATRS
jgi:hypothetical protein